MIRIKKSKKIFYCITSFALVSLATIGFSSWIISIEQPNQDFNVSINVDAMSFETVICDVKLKEENPTITLGPSSISDDGIVGGDGQNNEDLSASIEGNLIVADEMVEKIDKVTINLTSHKGNEQTNYNAISISNTDIFGRTPGTYYLHVLTVDNANMMLRDNTVLFFKAVLTLFYIFIRFIFYITCAVFLK